MRRSGLLLLLLISLALLGGCSFGPAYTRDGRPAPSPRAGEVVSAAETLLGTPYQYGGAGPDGVDCSGLIYYAYRQAGVAVPRTARGQYRAAVPVNPHRLAPGDLVFFQIGGSISHVGLYVGGDRFIHAPSSGKSVEFSKLDNPYWQDHIISAGRIPLH